jgi:hypothetical protein
MVARTDESEGNAERDEKQAARPGVAGKAVGRDDAHEPAHALLQERDPHEDQTKTRHCKAGRRSAAPGEKADEHANQDDRECGGADFEFETEQRDEPASHRRADVGAEDDAQRLRKREQAGAHEAHGRDGGCARRLHHGGGDGAGHRTGERAPGETAQQSAQGTTRKGA